jgi:DNA repair exonuclease SbcCD nuclease subunit
MLLLGGKLISLTPAQAMSLRKKAALRFVVASDGHFGQPDTSFDTFHDQIVEKISQYHRDNPLDFCVVNGDIVHDDPGFLSPAKSALDRIPVPYFVSKGNHDRVSDARWESLWGMPVNHEVRIKGNTLILATTSNEAGDYLSPDLAWMAARLEANRKTKNVFIFIHIPQAKWTANAIETPAFFELLQQHKNIRGVFHGHEHDQDGIKMVGDIPFMFDSHIGGSWGTTYRGFRVVELATDRSVLTYLMNPTEKINQASF